MDLVNADILAVAVLEGESPKEFFRRRRQREQAKHMYQEPDRVVTMDYRDWPEFEDMDNWQRVAMAEFQEIEGETAYVDASTQLIEVRQGDKSWTIFEDEDAAVAVAKARVEHDIDDEPETFNQEFLQRYINTNRLRNVLQPDEENQMREQYDSDWNDIEVKRDGLIGLDKLDETDFQDEDGEWLEITPELEKKIDDAYELFISDTIDDRLEDPVRYVIEMFGRAEGLKFAMEHGGIDSSTAAEAAVSADGWQHYLAPYDGNSYDLPSGSVYCRTN